MNIIVGDLKRAINEAIGALRMLDVIRVDIIVGSNSRDVKAEQILTEIRIIKGVATVSQYAAIARTPTGRRVMDLLISFNSKDMEKAEYIHQLGKTMKEIAGVDSVVFKALNEKPILNDDGKRPVY